MLERRSKRKPADNKRGAADGSQLDRAERERERVDQPREERHGRDQEDGDLRARRERDLRGELDVAPIGDDDCAAVLGRVADDRDDHRGDEEVGQVGLLGEGLDRADEDLRDHRGHDRRDGEHSDRSRQRPDALGLLGTLVHAPVPAQLPPGGADVEQEQGDRDRQREHGQRVPLGVAVPARDGGHEEERASRR